MSGDLAITRIEPSPDCRHFTQWRFDELGRLADELREILPTATDWTLRYDPRQDYHRLEWNHEGRHYVVRYYKVFAIYFDDNEHHDSPYPVKVYGRVYDGIIRLFKSGRYIDWSDA